MAFSNHIMIFISLLEIRTWALASREHGPNILDYKRLYWQHVSNMQMMIITESALESC